MVKKMKNNFQEVNMVNNLNRKKEKKDQGTENRELKQKGFLNMGSEQMRICERSEK
jgi:hypothetical protein